VGASAVMERAKKSATKSMGWAAKKFRGAKWAGNAFQKYKAERKKRADILDKTALSSRLGRFVGSKPGEWRDSLQSRGYIKDGKKFYHRLPGTKAAQIRQAETIKKDIAETRKKWKEEGVSEVDLQKYLQGKNIAKARAAALEMASKKGFGKTESDMTANFGRAVEVLKNDPVTKELFNDKVKEKNIKLVIDYEMDKKGIAGNEKEEYNIYEKYLEGMNAGQLSKQKNLLSNKNFVKTYMKSKAEQDPTFVEEIAKKMSRKDREAWIKEGLIGSNKKQKGNKAGSI
jgi:hypothetical protein